MTFDPSSRASHDSGLFGLPFSHKESRLTILPVQWEATTSYGAGTSSGPEAILHASHQVDLYDLETGKAYEAGYYMLPLEKKILSLSRKTRTLAVRKRKLEDTKPTKNSTAEIKKLTQEVNKNSSLLNDWVYKASQEQLEAGKLVGLVGGDHSTPYGLIKAIDKKFKSDFGILHIDAHHDLRKAYEGFKHSHASILYNVLEDIKPKKLVQVGIRDFSEDEAKYAESKNVSVYYDLDIHRRKAGGEGFLSIAKEIISKLPKNIYVTFDIDGLSPMFCPNTGTPVPGGLDYAEALILLREIHEQKKTLIGFDLNEVSIGDAKDASFDCWDANVGARLLYKLCGWTIKTN